MRGPQCSSSGPQSQGKVVCLVHRYGRGPLGCCLGLTFSLQDSELHLHIHCRLTFPLGGHGHLRFPVANREPWAAACSPFFLPASAPSQEAAPHLLRCSGQEPGRHFHSFCSATLNHPPASPIGSTSTAAQATLCHHPASSGPPT